MGYFRETIEKMEGYTPGFQPKNPDAVKLNTNENPYPPSPKVLEAIRGISDFQVRRYPDPMGGAFRQAASEVFDLPEDHILCVNGGDELLNYAFRAFCDADRPAAWAEPTYSLYPVLARLQDCRAIQIDRNTDSLEELARINAPFTIVCNPNAPTCDFTAVDKIAELASRLEGILLVDEAYVDFGGESCAELVRRYDNLLVVMTYSKSRSMAGARLGFVLGAKPLIDDLRRVQYSTNPYNVNWLTSTCGIAALRSHAYYDEMCALICRTRKQAAEALQAMGFWVLPSSANFLFARTERLSGETIYRKLKDRGILVRHFDAPRIREYNRITIGTPEDMDALLSALREIL